ncbi:hypothetical protein FGG08_000034 [Glutinoglossum americanum]|uniref:Uncharacterized protein n=1 Tax=Glutinoglossum americanum TaxID=1670608 RepID=A0A9P8IE22_9PEZI|nr:hypothetical protein FGG08_000034 [Glutinoglossum americanum]
MDKESNNVTVTEDIAEWDYGEYEGLLVDQIKEQRRKQGLDVGSSFNIWRDGCEGGESPGRVIERLDRLIAKIKEHQQPYMNGEKAADVVLVHASTLMLATVAYNDFRLLMASSCVVL